MVGLQNSTTPVIAILYQLIPFLNKLSEKAAIYPVVYSKY